MRLLIIGFMLTCFSIRASAQDSTPLAINNYLLDIFGKISELQVKLTNKLDKMIIAKDWQAMAADRNDMHTYCSDNIQILVRMHDVSGSYDLRQSLIKLMAYEDQFQMNYLNFDKFDATTTDARIDTKYTTMQQFIKFYLLPQLQVFLDAEGAYMKSNDIKY